jgi:hypothetical protein
MMRGLRLFLAAGEDARRDSRRDAGATVGKMPTLLSARCRRYGKMLARQLESYAASVLVAAHRGWDASFASLFLHVLECLLRVVERLLFRGNLVFVLAVFLVP